MGVTEILFLSHALERASSPSSTCLLRCRAHSMNDARRTQTQQAYTQLCACREEIINTRSARTHMSPQTQRAKQERCKIRQCAAHARASARPHMSPLMQQTKHERCKAQCRPPGARAFAHISRACTSFARTLARMGAPPPLVDSSKCLGRSPREWM